MSGQIEFAAFAVPDKVRTDFERSARKHDEYDDLELGRVIQVDRSLPLVCTSRGCIRCEHAISIVKDTETLAAVGDWVVVGFPTDHDNAVICEIGKRRNSLYRPDPNRKGGRQTLATNIDVVFIVVPLSGQGVDLGNLERQLVLAYQSDAEPVIVLSKADLADNDSQAGSVDEQAAAVREIAGDVPVIIESVESSSTQTGIEQIASLVPKGKTAVLLGRSGVGKSTLVNALLGHELQRTSEVRATDGKGRHTTIARRMVEIPGGGFIIDSPGLRSFALTGSFDGVRRAFSDIEDLSLGCRFRNCSHTKEPGCAVRAAVEDGTVDQRRYKSFLSIVEEVSAKTDRW